jgi:hypothetical protein
MAIVIENDLPVRFKIGVTMIDDPAPGQPLHKKHEMLARKFPQVRFTTIFEADGFYEDGFMTFVIQVPPAKVNG